MADRPARLVLTGRTADYVIPTGGYNGSGIGKDLGRQAVEASLRFKSVLIDFAT